MKDLEQIMSSDSSFRAYRTRLAGSDPPCIPYLGVYLTDLTFVSCYCCRWFLNFRLTIEDGWKSGLYITQNRSGASKSYKLCKTENGLQCNFTYTTVSSQSASLYFHFHFRFRFPLPHDDTDAIYFPFFLLMLGQIPTEGIQSTTGSTNSSIFNKTTSYGRTRTLHDLSEKGT